MSNDAQISDKSRLLTDLSPYIYGTPRLSDDKIPFEERVEVARCDGLYYRWSDELDMKAEIWTM